MHIGSVAIFDGGSLVTADAGIDIDRIRDLMQAELHRVPPTPAAHPRLRPWLLRFFDEMEQNGEEGFAP